MKTILACLLATIILATSARADVFIYRGTDKFFADATTDAEIKGGVLSVYVIVDYDAGLIATILYGHIEGAKRFQTSNDTVNLTNVNVPHGKTATLISTGSSNVNNPTSFNHSITFYRGTNATLLIRKTPATTTAIRPSVLKGLDINVSASSSFAEQHIGLTLQSGPTIKANNANQAIGDAVQTIIAQLMAQGFTSL